ncbi:MAG TPA: porin, partial [Longimicrobiales bacterium]
PIVWTAGLMWDAATREFLVRQTGIIVPVPEIWGHLWIGRSKEGISLNRVMVGYDGWTMERFTFSDASIPLLADGIKWLGYVPHKNVIWSLGVFADPLSKGQTFSHYEEQAVGRIAYLKLDPDSATLLHVGLGLRIGRPTDDSLRLRSKPESTTAPNFVDTGKFAADLSGTVGVEAYYRPGSWLFGGEYYFQKVDSEQTGSPVFHGGDIVATWMVSGEIRPYETKGAFFRAILPKRPVLEGGWGALELLLRLSYIDLTDGTLEGGKFWRLTPGLNWYLNRNLRLEVGYGYGVLDRFGMKGTTQFFQTRLQSQI